MTDDRFPISDSRAVHVVAGVITDARPGHVRISPYFYNVADDHRRALEILTGE